MLRHREPDPTFVRPGMFKAVRRSVALALGATLGVIHSANASGGRIAYVARVNDVSHLFLMDVDENGHGSNPRRITQDSEAENYPSWSPDGDFLIYQRDLDGAAIYIIRADGTGQRRLSPTPGFDVTASFSPDGSQIVYARLYGPPEPPNPPQDDLRVMNVDGSGDHSILQNVRFAVEPRWSIDNKIVFMSLMQGPGLDIYVMNADGSALEQITTNGASGLNNGDPVWNADGTRISFGSDRDGGGRVNVFLMTPDGSEVQQITHFDPPYEAGDTNWSSDNRKIAFEWDVGGNGQSNPDAYAEVWTMNPDGSSAVSTGIPCAGVGCAPRWQPAADEIFRNGFDP